MSLAGKFLLHAYHSPVANFRRMVAHGGPWQFRRSRLGREAMRRAAASLPALPAPAATAPGAGEIHLVTGSRFWDLTAFCLHSFCHQTPPPGPFHLHDDGTLNPETRDHLAALGSVVLHSHHELEELLEGTLPPSRFPVLHDRWIHYPNIRKLISPHLLPPAWKLVMDSDLLFFRTPDFLLDWLASPSKPLHAVDCEESYGYSRPLMEKLVGAPIAPLVNVGLTGLHTRDLDWERIEFFCRALQDAEGTNYYLEQALLAMLVAGRDCAVAPAADYITGPRPPEARDCRAVMHHYVGETKRWYFQYNWKPFTHPTL